MFGLVPLREGERAEFPLTNLRNEFRALYDRLMHPWEPLLGERFWGVNMEETEKEVVVRFEVPGFEPEELEVHLRGNELLMRAEKKVEPKDKEKAPPAERSLYERLVKLPVETDPEKVEALYHHGVLEVHLPRTEATLAKRVPVKVT